ncbi:MAG: quinolinate synthase NadA [Thermoplasmata archaeon]|nr:quinolinate synthase NadA [Thermoplasmata archaeon]
MEKLVSKIKRLKRERNIVILAHNYQPPEIQDIADFVGDSLDLSRKATKVSSKYIVFCGVNFMAESAQILNPDKVVLHPSLDARCPMADMVNIKELERLQDENPDALTVAYINTTAETKAMADICCTSANAVHVIKKLDAKKIIFVPDRNLGSYVKRFVVDKEIMIWPGYCHTHENISKDDILRLKSKYPNAEIMVHPECRPDVIDIADFVFSTNGMVKHVRESKAKEFIVGTEKGLCYRLRKENPDKRFYEIDKAVCPDMKKITLEKILASMENLEPRVELSSNVMEMAKKPLDKMLEI